MSSLIGIIKIEIISQASNLWIELFAHVGYISEISSLSTNLILAEKI